MASKNLKRLASEEHKLPMTPMIDVTFLLLIFFMCTLKFRILEGKLAAYLPKDVGVNIDDAEPIEKVEIVLRVRNEGTKLNPRGDGPWDGDPSRRFNFADDRLIEFSVGPRQTTSLRDLEERLREIYEAQPDRSATIDPKPGTVYGDVVGALDAAINAGFTSITFIGAPND